MGYQMGSQHSVGASGPRVKKLIVDNLHGGSYDKTLKLDVTHVSTIADAKKQLERITGIPSEEQLLLVGFRKLNDFEPVPTGNRVTLVRSRQTGRTSLRNDQRIFAKMTKNKKLSVDLKGSVLQPMGHCRREHLQGCTQQQPVETHQQTVICK